MESNYYNLNCWIPGSLSAFFFFFFFFFLVKIKYMQDLCLFLPVQ